MNQNKLVITLLDFFIDCSYTINKEDGKTRSVLLFIESSKLIISHLHIDLEHDTVCFGVGDVDTVPNIDFSSKFKDIERLSLDTIAIYLDQDRHFYIKIKKSDRYYSVLVYFIDQSLSSHSTEDRIG
jgi:hypothetical protein